MSLFDKHMPTRSRERHSANTKIPITIMENQTHGESPLRSAPCCALQCKDIPDRPILEMLAKNPKKWHNWCGAEWNVTSAMPPGTPPKLALAKMRTMIRRGAVDGCPCGCRGNFVITEKGLAEIYSHNH